MCITYVGTYVADTYWDPRTHRFWKRAGYVPLYLRQTQSELTGEHTCVMVRGLNSSTESELEWLGEFAKGVWTLSLPPFRSHPTH